MNGESPPAGNGKARNQDELTLAVPSRTTAIPLLKNLSEREIWVIFEIINFANYFQERELFPVNGGSLGYRMELAAAILATVFEHAAIEERQNASFPKDDPNFNFTEIILDLVVQRAREMQEQRNARKNPPPLTVEEPRRQENLGTRDWKVYPPTLEEVRAWRASTNAQIKRGMQVSWTGAGWIRNHQMAEAEKRFKEQGLL
jgi:hypothetical protein